jgi:hypothetical protein
MARWVLPVVLVAMIATAAGAIVARQIYASPEPSPSAIRPNESQLPPGEQPGSTTVGGTKDATAHPLYETVRALLQTHFDAINGKRYDQWRSVVTERRAKNQPERDWRTAYRSTRDGTIVVQRIETGPVDTARVLLSFTSVQDVRDAPLELPEHCIRWRAVFPMVLESGVWKLDSGPASSAPQHDAC